MFCTTCPSRYFSLVNYVFFSGEVGFYSPLESIAIVGPVPCYIFSLVSRYTLLETDFADILTLIFSCQKLHEAIMREESTEYEDGVIIEQYRKGFQLGDRLLRPSMVKVSAGPGPAKPEAVVQSPGETSGEGSSENTPDEE